MPENARSSAPVAGDLAFVDRRWEEDILPTLTRYIEIPAKSPAFDPDWAAHGHIDRAVTLIDSLSRLDVPRSRVRIDRRGAIAERRRPRR